MHVDPKLMNTNSLLLVTTWQNRIAFNKGIEVYFERHYMYKAWMLLFVLNILSIRAFAIRVYSYSYNFNTSLVFNTLLYMPVFRMRLMVLHKKVFSCFALKNTCITKSYDPCSLTCFVSESTRPLRLHRSTIVNIKWLI